MSTSRPLPRSVVKMAVCFVLGCPLLPRFSYAQALQSQTDQLATSISNVKWGKFADDDVQAVLKAGAAQQVLPALEEQFVSPTFTERQAIIANALVRLGDKDSTFWNFLLEQATLAVDSDIPVSGSIDGQLSPEITAWAQAHHIDVNKAVQSAMFELPGKVFLLGETGDPRGIPLLRRALQSRNFMIVVMAAKGLAQIQDKDSIPLIIEACDRSAKGLAGGIAEGSLVFFDDPQAQATVDTYVAPDRAKVWRDARLKGFKPFGFGY